MVNAGVDRDPLCEAKNMSVAPDLETLVLFLKDQILKKLMVSKG
jgi:hypothetical protein